MEREQATMHDVFARGLIGDIKNMHTRLLAGLPYHSDACTPAHLALAKQNLQHHVDVVGLAEQF